MSDVDSMYVPASLSGGLVAALVIHESGLTPGFAAVSVFVLTAFTVGVYAGRGGL